MELLLGHEEGGGRAIAPPPSRAAGVVMFMSKVVRSGIGPGGRLAGPVL